MTDTYPFRPTTIKQLEWLIDQPLGPSSWHDITQEKIDAFAELTGDRQWIHTDPERATPVFGSTIAHGLYSLSLGPAFMDEFLDLAGFSHALNYGYEKIRFPAPLPVNSRIRVTARVRSVDLVAENSANMITTMTYEREGHNKPICVADMVGRFTQ